MSEFVHPALTGPTQAERAATPHYIILRFSHPVAPEALEAVEHDVRSTTLWGQAPELEEWYRAYDDGFGRLVRLQEES